MFWKKKKGEKREKGGCDYKQEASILVGLLVAGLAIFYLFFSNESVAKGAGLNTLSMRTLPDFPTEYEKVTVLLQSFSFNLNSSEISVFEDGKLIKKEVGLKSFDFTTKGFGKSTKITVGIKEINENYVEKQLILTPGGVDLVYELNNPYKPFEYKGKSTYISNSAITIYAFPDIFASDGKKIADESLIYTWYRDGKIELHNSGFSKSTYSIDRLNAFPRVTEISVKVTDLNKKIVAKNKIVIEPKPTEIDFYLNNPSLPFSFKNIANPNLIAFNLEAELILIPFFMDTISETPVQYFWKINGKNFRHPEGSNKNRLLIINDVDKFREEINISILIRNRYRILQSVEESFDLIFAKSAANSGGEATLYNKGKLERSKDDNTSIFGNF